MTDTRTIPQSSADSDALDRAKQAASSAAEAVSSIAGQATGFAGKAVSALAGEAQQKATGMMHQQMVSGAEYVRSISQTAHSAARELEEKAPELARMVHDVADRAERFADDLRGRSADEMLDSAWTYARQNPRVFLGGAVAVGFLLARFAKSSAERSATARAINQPQNRSTALAGQSAGPKRGGLSAGAPSAGGTSTQERSAQPRSTTGGASYAG